MVTSTLQWFIIFAAGAMTGLSVVGMVRSTRRIRRYSRGLALIEKSNRAALTAEEERELDLFHAVYEFSHGVGRWR